MKINSTFNASKYVPDTDEEEIEMQSYSTLPDNIVTMQSTMKSDPSILERSRTDQDDMVQTTTARTTDDFSSLTSDASIQDSISLGVLPMRKRMNQMTETFQLMTSDEAQYLIDRHEGRSLMHRPAHFAANVQTICDISEETTGKYENRVVWMPQALYRLIKNFQ